MKHTTNSSMGNINYKKYEYVLPYIQMIFLQ